MGLVTRSRTPSAPHAPRTKVVFPEPSSPATVTSNPSNKTVNAGGSSITLNLAHAKVGSIELNTGASSDEITLGQASGSVPVAVNGGALNVHLHRPSGTSALVRVSGGAVNLVFDGKASHGFGSLEAGSADQTDNYRVDISGGSCNVTMDTGT